MKHSRWILSLMIALALAAVVLPAQQSGPARAQDGSNQPGLIVYASDRLGNYDIFTLDPETGAMEQLTNDPGADIEPVWSPDGQAIAFASDRDGDFELYVVRADGSDVQQLTRNDAQDRQPRWQPGGAFLVYVSDVNGQPDIYTISADGAIVRQVTNDTFDEFGPRATGAPGGQTGQPSQPSQPAATPIPPTPSLPDGTVASNQLNVRQNPGTGAPILITVPQGTALDIIGRRQDNTWLQVVTPTGITGWVSADLVTVNIDLLSVPVVNAQFIAPPPTATPAPTVQPTAAVVPTTISFTVDRTTIKAGECVTLSWFVEGIKEVYYQNQGVTGSGSRQECPGATTTYNLRVVRLDNVVDNRYITITVNP